MAHKRANKLVSLWITARSIWLTFYFSIYTLAKVYLTSYNREKIDKIIRLWANKLLRTVKLSYQVHNPHGVEFKPQQQYILMSNHASHYDIPILLTALPGSVRMIAKRELSRIPLFGRAMSAAEFLWVDRNNSEQAKKDLEVAKQKMKSGILVWIAPEGTRSRTGKLEKFKVGGFMMALQTGAIIVPLKLEGTFDILPPKTTHFQLGKHVHVHICKPIDASKYTFSQRRELMKVVRQSIESAGCAVEEKKKPENKQELGSCNVAAIHNIRQRGVTENDS